ncbi:MAG: hypothetical protein TREMPRED_004619 [Tremellales sp. Tagirdzhanova-0007]|nr:MAG: hypothetical protein TREMPRED_004619 [Tremellales sp. Tagirdzhanova-0007]
MVSARDGVCLLTGRQPPHRLDAAHIVPQSRPDVYRQLLGVRASEDMEVMYNASAGLLLSPGPHSSFDDLEWSLYQRGDSFIVHYFLPASDDEKRLNGMKLPPDRFRFMEAPDERLVAWHYNQAVKARIRGFAVDMRATAHRDTA